MSTWLCEKCGSEFKDQSTYKSHRPHCPGATTDPVSGEPLEPLEMPEELEEKKTETRPEGKGVAPEEIEKEKKPSPPKLTYAFLGVCGVCGRPINTIELDALDKHFVSAYCVFCKRQEVTKEVPLL